MRPPNVEGWATMLAVLTQAGTGVNRFVACVRRPQCQKARPISGAPYVAGCVAVQRAAAVGFAAASTAVLALVFP